MINSKTKKANAMVAYGVIDEVLAEGLSIPGDYSVCGFDNIYPSQFHGVALTTIDHHINQRGRKAFSLLKAKLERTGVEDSITHASPGSAFDAIHTGRSERSGDGIYDLPFRYLFATADDRSVLWVFFDQLAPGCRIQVFCPQDACPFVDEMGFLSCSGNFCDHIGHIFSDGRTAGKSRTLDACGIIESFRATSLADDEIIVDLMYGCFSEPSLST